MIDELCDLNIIYREGGDIGWKIYGRDMKTMTDIILLFVEKGEKEVNTSIILGDYDSDPDDEGIYYYLHKGRDTKIQVLASLDGYKFGDTPTLDRFCGGFTFYDDHQYIEYSLESNESNYGAIEYYNKIQKIKKTMVLLLKNKKLNGDLCGILKRKMYELEEIPFRQ